MDHTTRRPSLDEITYRTMSRSTREPTVRRDSRYRTWYLSCDAEKPGEFCKASFSSELL